MIEFWGQRQNGMKFADLHMHTSRSDGRMSPVKLIDEIYLEGSLNAIAVTDHETIAPAIDAKNYALKKGYGIEVIVGCELTTADGHLLGLFLNQNIPSGKGLEWTIDEIHKQNGLAVVAHPMYRWTHSITRESLMRIMDYAKDDIWIDGFEMLNAGVGDNPFTYANFDARSFYTRYQERLGAAIGSTDGHFYTFGRGLTGYTGDLCEAIFNKQTVVFDGEEREHLAIVEVGKQLFGSMILEPKRRVERWIKRS